MTFPRWLGNIARECEASDGAGTGNKLRRSSGNAKACGEDEDDDEEESGAKILENKVMPIFRWLRKFDLGTFRINNFK